MRKIYFCFFLSSFWFGKVDANYLDAAATAWGSVLPAFGPEAQMAAQFNSLTRGTSNYDNLLATIAYNNSSIILFSAQQHIADSFAEIAEPAEKRTDCDWHADRCHVDKKSLLLSTKILGGEARFNGDDNNYFKTTRSGIAIVIGGYVGERTKVGILFANIASEMRDDAKDISTNANSLTAFVKHMKGIAFINIATTIGNIAWNDEKFISGISNNAQYDTNLFAAEAIAGATIRSSGNLKFIPSAGAQYANVNTATHADNVIQTFGKWSYGAVSGIAEIKMLADFPMGGWSLRPEARIGGIYRFAQTGASEITATLVNGSMYEIPVSRPSLVAANVSISLTAGGPTFSATARYRIDSQADYTAYTASLGFRAAF